MFRRSEPWLHVIAGCMSSGKTETMIRLLRRAEIARCAVICVRPSTDDRAGDDFAVSRSSTRFPTVRVAATDPDRIITIARDRDADVVGIEEAQFFTPGIVEAVETLRASGRQVIASGLALDFAGRPFGSMADLLVRADEVEMLTAICMVCGGEATRTQRLVRGRPAAIDDPLVIIGGFDGEAPETYEARCLRHHEVGAPRAG